MNVVEQNVSGPRQAPSCWWLGPTHLPRAVVDTKPNRSIYSKLFRFIHQVEPRIEIILSASNIYKMESFI